MARAPRVMLVPLSIHVCHNLRQNRPQQCHEVSLNPLASRQDIFLAEHLIRYPRGHVGHRGNGQYLYSHVASRDDFRNRRHANQIRADRTEVSNLRRSFVTRAQESCVDTLMHRLAQALRGSRGDLRIGFEYAW